MKLKLGNTILNQRALTKVFIILLIFGIYVGASFVLKSYGEKNLSLPLLIVLVVTVPRLVQGIQKEIKNERNIENEEAL